MSGSLMHSRANLHHPPGTILSHLHGVVSFLLPNLALTEVAPHSSSSLSSWHQRRLATGISGLRMSTRSCVAGPHHWLAGNAGGAAGDGGGAFGLKSLMHMWHALHMDCWQFSAQLSLHQSRVHSSVVSRTVWPFAFAVPGAVWSTLTRVGVPACAAAMRAWSESSGAPSSIVQSADAVAKQSKRMAVCKLRVDSNGRPAWRREEGRLVDAHAMREEESSRRARTA